MIYKVIIKQHKFLFVYFRSADGLSVRAVPKTDRCVSSRVLEQDSLKVFSNRPSDVVHSNILNNINMKTINHLQLCTSQQGIIYSEDEHLPSEDEWKGLFRTLGTHVGYRKIHTMTISHTGFKDTLLLVLRSSIQNIYNHGVTRLISTNG